MPIPSPRRNLDFDKAVATLRNYSAELNRLADDATTCIKAVENLLQSNNVGVYAAIQICDATDHQDNAHFLEYRRVGGRFRLAHVIGAEPENEKVRALAECSREEKLEAVPVLIDLIKELAEKTEIEAARARECVSTVSRLFGVASKTPQPRDKE